MHLRRLTRSGLIVSTSRKVSTKADRAQTASRAAQAQTVVQDMFVVGEMLIPDTRMEFDPSVAGVLSWPVSAVAGSVRPTSGSHLVFVPFVEPQIQFTHSEYRLSSGTRLLGLLDATTLGVLFELAGVLGTDGHGCALGGGITLAEQTHGELGWTVSLVYRHTWTLDGSRHDLSLDIAYPLHFGT